MTKKNRSRRARKKGRNSPVVSKAWFDEEGLHALVPDAPRSPEMLDEATRLYQQNIRNSPLWDKMVREFGEEEAERLLKQFRVEVR